MTNSIALKRPLALAFAYLCAFISGVTLCAVLAFYLNQARIIASNQAQFLWHRALSAVTVTELRYRDPAAAPLDSIIELVSKEYDLPDVVLRALVDQESSGGTALYRFEESVYVRRSTLALDAKLSVDERHMLASSHGVAHVMGYRAEPDCKIHWSQLYSPVEGLRCAARILKSNLGTSKAKGPADRLRDAFKRYNGSGPDADYYADHMMARVGELLFKRLGEKT